MSMRQRLPVSWLDDLDGILAGAIVVAVGSPIPEGGVVLNVVTPIGLPDRADSTVTFSPSLGLGPPRSQRRSRSVGRGRCIGGHQVTVVQHAATRHLDRRRGGDWRDPHKPVLDFAEYGAMVQFERRPGVADDLCGVMRVNGRKSRREEPS